MKRKSLIAFAVATVIITVLYTPCCYSINCYNISYYLLENFNSPKRYKLNVVVPQSLYEYYRGMDHKQVSVEDFAKFITPFSLKPIADKLWDIYSDFEEFANGVLMIVHQIPYEITLPPKYPVETIVENVGDCDLFSYVAASVLKAGGLDAVLLYYPDKSHMNIGVHLPTQPRYARMPACYVTHNGIRYYIAECTGGNWMTGWRVGECPDDLRQAKCQIVSLEKYEEWAPEQVAASYKALQPSSISLALSSNFGIQGSMVTISGQLSPKLQNISVTIYFRMGGSSWNMLAIVETDYEGKFSWTWIAGETGVYQFRASWSGNDDFAGADSPTVTMTVFSAFILILFMVTAALICAGFIIFLKSSQGYHKLKSQNFQESH